MLRVWDCVQPGGLVSVLRLFVGLSPSTRLWRNGFRAALSASLVLIGWFLPSLDAWGQTGDLDKLLREGHDNISQGQFSAAVEVLSRATAANPKSSYANHLLGLAFRGLKNDMESMRCLCEALQLDPGNDEIRKSLAEGLRSGLPAHAREATLRTLQEVYYESSWSRDDFTLNAAVTTDAASTRTYRAFCTSGTLFPPEVPQRDPLHAQMAVTDLPDAWKFNRVTYGYLKESPAEDWSRRFRLFYISPFLAKGGKDYGPLSQMLCRTALQVYATVKDNLGSISSGDSVINIWLCEQGEAGAQQPLQAPGHIYFYDINRQRPWSEWLREMAHEYGHLLLPPFGGYSTAKEPLANGEIGERLFVPWIRAVLQLRPETFRLEDRKELDNYVAARTDAALKLFLQEGPESPVFLDRGDWGVEDLAGFCLWISRTHSPAFLRACMDAALEKVGAQGLRSADLRDSYQRLFAENAEKDVPYRVGLTIPKFTQPAADAEVHETMTLKQNDTLGYWVYLPAGTWEVKPRMESSGPGVVSFAWNGAGYEEHGLILNPQKQSGVVLEQITAGWRVLSIRGKNLPSPVGLQMLSFRKTP